MLSCFCLNVYTDTVKYLIFVIPGDILVSVLKFWGIELNCGLLHGNNKINIKMEHFRTYQLKSPSSYKQESIISNIVYLLSVFCYTILLVL